MTILTLPLERLLASKDHEDFSGRRALTDVSACIAKARKVVVVSGAGISCSSGIPDFRSEGGLYSLVKAKYPESFVTGKDLFTSSLFSNPKTTSLFLTFIAELALACNAAQPTKTHHFLNKLEHKGKLLRSYTQNVDGLERRIGLNSGGRGEGLKKKGTRNIELHGDLGRVRCVLCMSDYPAKAEWIEMFREGEAPECPACYERSASRLSRAARALPIGTLRPAIVLYDEPHPLGDDIGDLQTYDLARGPDVLLIMGTSLKVHGLKRLVKEFAKSVHSKKTGKVIFVNTTPPSKEWEGVIDVHVHGETDAWVERVESEWRSIRPSDWETQAVLDDQMQVIGGTSTKVPAKAKGAKAPKAKNTASKATSSKVLAERIENLALALPNPYPTPEPSQQSVQTPSSPSQSSCASSELSPPPDDLDVAPRPTTPKSASSPFHLRAAYQMPSPPLTPHSPSKRPPSRSSDLHIKNPSPLKKSKTVVPLSPERPTTGVMATPGKGNLFAAPPQSPRERIPLSNKATWYTKDEQPEEVFGSPVKASIPASPSKKRGGKKTAGAVAVDDKENAPVRQCKKGNAE